MTLTNQMIISIRFLTNSRMLMITAANIFDLINAHAHPTIVQLNRIELFHNAALKSLLIFILMNVFT